ncbi:MAG: thrombospondin type 3 repeat-containing protein [Deltaproteobacteria bacterium]|nr:thrombospondin type 3 repeat-containing protein [Deltaproteobacteria bacterium]
MRVGIACVIALAASCFAPSPPRGAPCAPVGAGERCPSGQQCIGTAGAETCEPYGSIADSGVAADAAVSIDAPGDRDHDGIIDSLDDCPDVANPTQADEDGDGLGDVCDPCPPFVDNHDSDGDGLGDACDPNPMVAGDTLVAFDGFQDALSGSWTVMGTFAVTGGDGVLSAADGATSLLTWPSPGATHVEIRAAFAVGSITATGLNLGAIGLIDRLQPSTDKAVTCQLAALAAGNDALVRIFDTSASASVASASYAFAAGDEKQLHFDRVGTTYVCSVASPAAGVHGTAAFAPASPRIGLRVHGASARWHWVMIVTSP